MCELLHVALLREHGKLHLLEKHWSAASTVAWFFFGRKVVYPTGDLIVGMFLKKQIWCKQ